MLRIEAVMKGSRAEGSGLKKGDAIIALGSEEVRDVIDFVFHSQRDELPAAVRRGDKQFRVRLRRDENGVFGLRFEPFRPIICSNKCLFCFVDQLPSGLRKTLYVKDEDYRLSFLYGNFVTMTNLGPSAIKRIVAQRLSPLYVSVHATNPSVRAKLLGKPRDPGVLRKLRVLTENGIKIHAQVVLCPGINDGKELERTIEELKELSPGLQSVAVVPVGLTRFRKSLPSLRAVDQRCSDELLERVSAWQKTLVSEIGTRFVFAADEFYLQSGSAVPSAKEYESFPQLENGVGLVCLLLKNATSIRRRLRAKARGRPVAILTGKLTERICSSVFNGEGTRTVGIENRFFGRSITVSGLLAGRDILRAMRSLRPGEVAAISGSCLNEEGLFLDGLQPDRLEEMSGHRLIVEGIRDAKRDRDYSGPTERGEVHAFQ